MKKRSKYYGIELYEESENLKFSEKIEIIKKYDYAYIWHDKDNSKKHAHLVLAFNNYRYQDAVCEELNIPSNYVEPINSIDGMLTYLIHLNQPNKHQYDVNEVIGTTKVLNMFKKALKNNGKVEEDKVLELIEFITKSEYLTLTRFIKYACSIGMFDIVRRSQYLFNKIIDEHNEIVLQFVDDIKLSWYNERE